MISTKGRRGAAFLPILLGLTLATATVPGVRPAVFAAQGAFIAWARYQWTVTTGGMAGNVFVDPSGFLHLMIRKSDRRWRCAELFTTDRLGFGTYQWQVEGRLDKLDPNVVLGQFPYGPQAGVGKDGTNEIDIEYSRWGYPSGPNGDWTVYPATGRTIGDRAHSFSLRGPHPRRSFGVHPRKHPWQDTSPLRAKVS